MKKYFVTICDENVTSNPDFGLWAAGFHHKEYDNVSEVKAFILDQLSNGVEAENITVVYGEKIGFELDVVLDIPVL